MTASPVLRIAELHGPDAGMGRGLSTAAPDIGFLQRTHPNASRKLQPRHLPASPASPSARYDRRENPIQTP
jgi:hypothetical protein